MSVQQEPGLGCQRRRPSDIVHCAVTGHKITVATARTESHWRAGDFSGDYPEDHPKYIAPVRPDNAEACASCGNCED